MARGVCLLQCGFAEAGSFTIVERFRGNSMIHVIAIISTAPSRREDFLKEFHRLVPLVHAETGCIEYGPAIDVDSGIEGLPAARADVVTILEKWEDVAALKAHLVAPHMLTYREAVKDLVEGVEIRVLDPA